MHAATAFFGTDQMAYSVVKVAAGAPAVTRSYTRFSDVVADGIEVRIYHGVHFRASDVQGALIGKNVAQWQAQRYFQRVPGPPPTGTGGNLPGMPNTGAGGAADRQLVVWLVFAAGGALVVVDRLLRRGGRRV